ncbi:MAG: PAS domain-containing protein [Deltaproteobacteria bacterium]|nr:PAS domain-containing protein [Deltaproteobacteria bacterium]MBW2075846.1 PAS domain-containing protein [Deltaproteobacteria bacterium]RLB82594.1 MAG: hypothetical protein DRH17_05520 [Deltaproteobacteria bacterium]
MEQVKALNVAIVGGGPGCKAIMDMIFAAKLSQLRMKLIGVACTNPKDVGYRYAQEKGIYTTRDYRDLYKLKDLGMIIELTGREEVANEISRTKPNHVRLMDHVAARLFWDIFQIEEKRITERMRAEGALRESEERLKTILETIQAGIVVIDPETHIIVGVNAAAGEMIGAPREQILSSMCHKYICPAEKGQCPITDLGQNFDNVEWELLTASGKRVPILKTVVSVILSGREHLLESFVDIAKRKQAEKERERLIGELQEALAKVKTLSGLLPICASCKRIRDDQGYWQQIEAYIGDHSEAQFSHGVCPECAKKLYPEVFDKKL